MPDSDPVLWLGRLAEWACALDGPIHEVDDPDALRAEGAEAGLAVVEGQYVSALSDWMRQTRRRPAVVVLVGSEEGEVAALRAGADEALLLDADADAALRAVRRARARHAASFRDMERYRLMADSSPYLTALVDSSWRYVYVSPAAEEQTGYPPDELIGTSVLDRLHPDDREAVAEEFAAGLDAPGTVRSLRFRIQTPDGEARYMEGVGRVVAGVDGDSYGVLTARDVTERKQTEDRLLASEARYRTVVRALPDVISRLGPDGHVLDFHVPAAFETEFPAASMIGRTLPEVIPDDLAQKFLDAAQEMDATGEPVAYDYQVTVGRTVKHREVRMAPFGDAEILSMIRDVTDLRENQTALEESRAELRALATHLQEVREDERTRLSREVHDVLGQQLTAIRLGVGWFGRHYPDEEPIQSRLAGIRETIDETIRHVREIATDLRPGVLDDFGLQTAVEWEAERFEARTGVSCQVHLACEHAPGADVATAAFRVLQEALTNVARHAEATSVAVTLSLEADAVRLVIEDDGRGIDPDQALHHRTLGLLGMTERARALGGTLEITSTPGEGTAVECTFPLQPSDPSPSSAL